MAVVQTAARAVRQNELADSLTAAVAENDGLPPPENRQNTAQNPAPFSLQFFIAAVSEGKVTKILSGESAGEISQAEMTNYAEEALSSGKSRGWLDASDIRSEGKRMNELITQLILLSRLDEGTPDESLQSFLLSEVVAESAEEFSRSAEYGGKKMCCQIDEEIVCKSNKNEIRRLVGILLDNAVKYCDEGGEISVTLTAKRNAHTAKRYAQLVVENSFAAVDELDMERLFERFYRADTARTAGSSFGIGLSLAQAIAEKYHVDIRVQKSGHEKIAFLLRF